MSHELLYTSAPQGLKSGSRGFCTVEMTEGIPPGLVDRLESLSGYRQAFPIHDPRAKDNPVNYSHLLVPAAGRRFHVLSRVADAGQDYTGRSNKLAHHVALEPQERPAGNPAWVLRQPGFCQTNWDGTPRVLPSGRRPASGTRGPAPCPAWKEAAGDAGWAGVLIQAAMQSGAKPVSVIYPAGLDVLPLVEEALALVPGERQWEVTFSTYFTKLPAGIECQWRFVLDDTPEARELRRNARADVIDLCGPSGKPPEGRFVNLARQERLGRAAAPPALPPHRAAARSHSGPAAPAERDAASAPAAATATPPPISAASAPPAPPTPPVPPQRPRESAAAAASAADDTYGLSSPAPPPRWTTSTATAGDPRAARSLAQLERGEPDSVRESGRGLGFAALAVVAVFGIALTAYILGRVSNGTQDKASEQRANEAVAQSAQNAPKQPPAQTTASSQPVQGASEAANPKIPLPDAPRPGSPAEQRPPTVPLNSASEVAERPSNTAVHPAARGENGASTLESVAGAPSAAPADSHDDATSAAEVPSGGLGIAPEPADATAESGNVANAETRSKGRSGTPPKPLQQDSQRRTRPDATPTQPRPRPRRNGASRPKIQVVIGNAELDLLALRAAGPSNLASGVWYRVLPGTEATISVKTKRSLVVNLTIVGADEGGLLSIDSPISKDVDAPLFLSIRYGKLVLKLAEGPEGESIRIAHVRDAVGDSSSRNWESLALPKGRDIAVHAAEFSGEQSHVTVYSGRSPHRDIPSVMWRNQSTNFEYPRWYAVTEPGERPKEMVRLDLRLAPGVHPLNSDELRNQLTQIKRSSTDEASQLAQSALDLLENDGTDSRR